MTLAPVDNLAVLVSAIAAMALGAAWYSPALFAKPWMESMGWSSQKIEEVKKKGGKGMNKAYALTLVGALIMACVMAQLLASLNIGSTGRAVKFAFMLWLAFVVPSGLGLVLWEGRSMKYFWITTGYYLASFAMVAMILTAWN